MSNGASDSYKSWEEDLEKKLAKAETHAYDLMCKVAKLESEVERLTTRVAELSPKPKVESKWLRIYSDSTYGPWKDTKEDALRDAYHHLVCLIRKDTLTHVDGRVECKVEIEHEII